MVKSLQFLRGELHARFLKLRNLDRFVASDVFEKTYSAASADQKRVAEKLVTSCDTAGLDKWVNDILRSSRILEEFSITELRTLCGELGVSNYRHMTKQMLVSAVRQHREKSDNGKAGSGTICVATPPGDAVSYSGVRS